MKYLTDSAAFVKILPDGLCGAGWSNIPAPFIHFGRPQIRSPGLRYFPFAITGSILIAMSALLVDTGGRTIRPLGLRGSPDRVGTEKSLPGLRL
jgi:hypothetical protein